MNKTVSIIVFAVLAVAVIWGAVWYNSRQAHQAEQQAAQQVQSQAAPVSNSASSTTSTTNTAPTQTMDNGLQIKDTVVGTGATAQDGDTLTVNYTGTLDNGTVFDSSLNPGRTPFVFPLGAGQVIQGWDLGMVGMKVGGTRELTIPPSLGYGSQAVGPIPANSTLHFTVTLLSVSSGTSN